MEKAFGISVSRLRLLLGKMEQRPKFVRDIVLTCVVLHNMLRTRQGGSGLAATPANHITALQNEQVVNVPHDNYRNPLREAKHKQDLLKDYFNHLAALAGQEDRIWRYPGDRKSWHLAALFMATRLFQELYLSWCWFQQIKKKTKTIQ